MKPLLVKLGMCSLNNDPLSFKKNRDNIISSIKKCKQLNCMIRVGSQLQVPGYSCADHFNQYDTIIHSWQIIRDIIQSGVTQGICCDIGSPVLHHGNIYNCRIILYNGKVMGIRAKTILADGDNYYQTRWFGFWKQKNQVDQFKLPSIIQKITNQTVVPIGVFLIDFNDVCLGYQICQQAWISDNPMIDAVMDGAQIMLNPSASNVQRGKLARKIQMLKQHTQRHGGSYLYTNVKGCTGDRIYFDGGCIFTENGVVKGLSNLNTLQDIIVTSAVVNITNIRTFRLSNKSYLKSNNGVRRLPRVKIPISVAICQEKYTSRTQQTNYINQLIEEYQFPHARFQPSLFLWDYLRKSKANGFFLPLSGGLDSTTVALIVYNMCMIVFTEINQQSNHTVLQDLRRIVKQPQYKPKSAQQICHKILYTCYMKTDYSSQQTQKRARQIARSINCHHRSIDFHKIFQQVRNLGSDNLGKQLKFTVQGGSKRTDKALQNIQGRARMMISYLFAQTQLEVLEKDGFLLVLGSSNLDEQLTGYYTKYDTSSADINPIGSFSKTRLKQFVKWNNQFYKFKFIDQLIIQKPMTQLTPLEEGQVGLFDEACLGLTYNQIGTLGRLRRVQKLGPVSMFETICGSQYNVSPRKVAEKIKLFFQYYGKKRHKMTVLTPSLHYYPEGCDDNRLDLRPMFYETNWDYHFELIDKKVKEIEQGLIPEIIKQQIQISNSKEKDEKKSGQKLPKKIHIRNSKYFKIHKNHPTKQTKQ